MKKKVLLLFASLALVTTLAVNGTLANELKTVAEQVSKWFNEKVFNGPTLDLNYLDVDIVTSDTGTPLAPANCTSSNIDWNNTVGVVTRTVTAENNATKDAYVRICIAVRTDVTVLQHQVTPYVNTDDYTVSYKTDVKIGGKTYALYTFDYQTELANQNTTTTNDVTSPILVKLLLTKETTNAHMTALGSDFLLIKSFAIESDVFVKSNTTNTNDTTSSNSTTTQMSATEALTSALGAIGSFNPFE